jgi:ATP-dependent protease ClpP protease subunit
MPDKLPGMKWFYINAKQAADTAQEIFIFGDIGESWFGESITAKQFVDELAALDTALPLTIRINSIGGSVIDGLAIYNAIKRHEGEVTVSIEGIAASIAGLIAMAGDTVEIAENARLMVHAPWGSTAGNAQKLRQYADQLDAWAESMCACYVAKTGKPRDEMLALLKDGTDHWYSADEAMAEGFADTVGPAVKVAASLDISRYTTARPQASVVKPTKETRMTEAEIRAAAEAKACHAWTDMPVRLYPIEENSTESLLPAGTINSKLPSSSDSVPIFFSNRPILTNGTPLPVSVSSTLPRTVTWAWTARLASIHDKMMLFVMTKQRCRIASDGCIK